MRIGNNNTPEIITNKGTHGRTKLPHHAPDKNSASFVSNRATKGSQQCAKITKKHANMRNKSTHPIGSRSLPSPIIPPELDEPIVPPPCVQHFS